VIAETGIGLVSVGQWGSTERTGGRKVWFARSLTAVVVSTPIGGRRLTARKDKRSEYHGEHHHDVDETERVEPSLMALGRHA
jgi:hypothetical protein